jgi:uncharacterized membrane protein YeiH
LDILGVIVLAFVTALGGGIIRDLLLGALPPNAIRDWRYPAIALVTGVAMFLLHARASTMASPLLLTLDAAGISFVAVAGATKALEFNLHPLLATMLGGISGVGGGTVRDMLINRIPLVLQADVYAAAALLGAAVAVLLIKVRVRPWVANAAGIAACFSLRMLAIRYHLNLPVARS